MLNKVFDVAYKRMYKYWVLNKMASSKEGIDLFYLIPNKFDYSTISVSNVMPLFSNLYNGYLNDTSLKAEFSSYYKKDCLLSLLEYIIKDSEVLKTLGDKGDLKFLCYVNHIFSFIVSEHFINPVNAEKVHIVFDGSMYSQSLVSKLLLASKYNNTLTCSIDCFDVFDIDWCAGDIRNYVLPDYMMLSNFIKVVGLSEGAKLLVSYFEKSKSERSSFGDYYLEKNWGLFETYSELLDFCAEEYNKDSRVNHGYFEKVFSDFNNCTSVQTYEQSVVAFMQDISNVLGAFIVSETAISDGRLNLCYYSHLLPNDL